MKHQGSVDIVKMNFLVVGLREAKAIRRSGVSTAPASMSMEMAPTPARDLFGGVPDPYANATAPGRVQFTGVAHDPRFAAPAFSSQGSATWNAPAAPSHPQGTAQLPVPQGWNGTL